MLIDGDHCSVVFFWCFLRTEAVSQQDGNHLALSSPGSTTTQEITSLGHIETLSKANIEQEHRGRLLVIYSTYPGQLTRGKVCS